MDAEDNNHPPTPNRAVWTTWSALWSLSVAILMAAQNHHGLVGVALLVVLLVCHLVLSGGAISAWLEYSRRYRQWSQRAESHQ